MMVTMKYENPKSKSSIKKETINFKIESLHGNRETW